MPKRPTTTITRAVEEEYDAPEAKHGKWEPGDTFGKDGKIHTKPGEGRDEDVDYHQSNKIAQQAQNRTKNWWRFKYGAKSNKRNLGEDLNQPKISETFANIKKTRNIGPSQFEQQESEFYDEPAKPFYDPAQFHNEDTRDSLAEQEAGNMEAMEEGGAEGGAGIKGGKRVGSGANGGAGGSSTGSINGELMPIQRPIGQPGGSVWYTRTFTKTFLFAIENCNWVRTNFAAPVATNLAQHISQPPYYTFPLDRKFMYIDPVEWLNLHDNKSIIKCLGTKAQFRYKSYRPYFVTGGTDLQVASNTATPYINVYCNMRHKMPYQMWENQNPTTATDPGKILLWDPNTQDGADYTKSGWTFAEEMLDRLYGDAWTGFGEAAGEETGLFLSNTGSIGAVDGPRRWYIRPAWHVNVFPPPPGNTSRMPRSIGDFVSGAHLESYKELELPGTALGAGFEVDYQPCNALWKAASSVKLDPCFTSSLDAYAVGSNIADNTTMNPGFLPYAGRSYNCVQMAVAGGLMTYADVHNQSALTGTAPDIMTNEDWDWLRGSPTAKAFNDRMQRSYFESIDQSAMQELGNPRDLQTPQPKDIWIGVTPQIQTDGTLLRGICEIELKTEMTVAIKVHDSHFAMRVNIRRDTSAEPAAYGNTIRTFSRAKQFATRIFDETTCHVNTHIHDFHTGYVLQGRAPKSYITQLVPSYASVDNANKTPPVRSIKPTGTALN